MPSASDSRCRLCLVTPPAYEVEAFAPRLGDALAGGDVASLIITAPNTTDAGSLQKAAERLVPVAAARNVAALVHNDTRVAARAQADGVHIDSGIADVEAAIAALRGRKIVGASAGASRHEALEAGDLEPDYLFFGRLDGDTDAAIFPKALDLAAWWASVTVIPAIVMGGAAIASVEEAAAQGIEFVALSSAVWNHPKGPSAAVADAVERLAAAARGSAA
jgi:thiamine-phosphate pyrophosphorylase